MQMDAGLDTGDMLIRATVPIMSATTASDLHDQLARLGAGLVVQALASSPCAVPQPVEGATYAPKLRREDGRINWQHDAASIDRQVRALNPWPSTFSYLGDVQHKLLEVKVEDSRGEPGSVLDNRLLVACGSGALRILRIQAPGRAAMTSDEFLRGRKIAPGDRFA